MAEDDRQSHDQEFVEYVVKSIVDHPDDVKLERSIDEMGVLITLTVNPEDMGQVIGRSGITAKSIRTLLRVIGARNNARVNLKINEPAGGETRSEEQPEGTSKPSAEAEPSPETKEDAGDQPKQSVEEAIDDLEL